MQEDHLDQAEYDALEHFSAERWELEREQQMLEVFRQTAATVPAYTRLLREADVAPDSITSFKAFQQLPTTSKADYLKPSALHDLCRNGTLRQPLHFSATSGSTGTPFYFPRGNDLAWQSSFIHERFLRRGGAGHESPTLVLICFGLGVWIGGMITYQAFDIAARRGQYPVSILAPGVNKAEILNALRDLAPNFAQTIIVGYPPFVKDVVDSAIAEGIPLTRLRLRFSFAAEAFTESFRNYLTNAAGSIDPCLDTLNIYGSADIGAMAAETPLSIAIRRLATSDGNAALFESLFGKIEKTPTLAQYNPRFINFESLDGELLLTGRSAIPLVRYAIGDRGGVLSYREMAKRLAAAGTPIERLIDPAWPSIAARPLPFVFVYERTDHSTTLYGLQIYPEHVRDALIRPAVAELATGRFVLATKSDDAQNQFLEINVEARAGVVTKPPAESALLDEIVATLLRLNSEYRELHRSLGAERSRPRLVVWPAACPPFFEPRPKHKWV